MLHHSAEVPHSGPPKLTAHSACSCTTGDGQGASSFSASSTASCATGSAAAAATRAHETRCPGAPACAARWCMRPKAKHLARATRPSWCLHVQVSTSAPAGLHYSRLHAPIVPESFSLSWPGRWAIGSLPCLPCRHTITRKPFWQALTHTHGCVHATLRMHAPRKSNHPSMHAGTSPQSGHRAASSSRAPRSLAVQALELLVMRRTLWSSCGRRTSRRCSATSALASTATGSGNIPLVYWAVMPL